MDLPWPAIAMLAQLASTLYMVGVIWFVQLVHYPLLSNADRGTFMDHQRTNVTRTTWVVGPPILLEGASAILLLQIAPARIPPDAPRLGLALLILLWLSTALVQVPCHATLTRGFDDCVHRRLVQTNWFRTLVWNLRGALVLWMAARLMA